MSKRTLVFCSAGARISSLSWLKGTENAPDIKVALVYYGKEPLPAPPTCDFYLQNQDYKVPNFLHLIKEVPAALDFDLFVFIDDDIILTFDQLMKWRQTVETAGLDVSQPALTVDSKADWPHVKHQSGLTLDEGQFVEIQCFALSRRALQIALPYFFMVKTGAGLDVALYRLAQGRGLRSAVVHSIQATHPHRQEAQTVRAQFSEFSVFNQQMSRFMDFCFPTHAPFAAMEDASRILGDTRPGTVRWFAAVRFMVSRASRVLSRLRRLATRAKD